MTTAEACELVVSLTRQLSETRTECASWRIVGLAMTHHAAELERELQMLDERRYVHRALTQDRLDVFLDQTDLRRQAAA